MSECSGNCDTCNTCAGYQVMGYKIPMQKEMDEFYYNSDEMSHPSAVFLGVTSRCNLSCPYCFVQQKNEDMSLETAIAAVDLAIANSEYSGNTPHVIFFGGEPLLKYNEIIVPIVKKYADQCTFSITTNGVLLNEDIVDFFVANNVSVLLSFDGVKKVQDSQRPGKGFSSFERILNNIPYLLFRMPDITMRATVTKNSLPYLYESFCMGVELGFVNFSFCINAYEEWDDDDAKLYASELNKIGAEVYYRAVKMNPELPVIRVSGLTTGVLDFNRVIEDKSKFNNHILRCGLGTTTFTVCPNGDITTCQERLSHPTHIIGNVKDGIDFNKHLEFLKWYYEKLKELKCPFDCSSSTMRFCLQRICPSRLEDMDFRLSTALCKSEKIEASISSRLWKLTRDSSLSGLRYIFKNYEEEEEEE